MRPGNIIAYGTEKLFQKVNNICFGMWYRLSWTIGHGAHFSGPIKRRSYGGTAKFGDRCYFGHLLVIDVATGGTLLVGNDVSINAGTFISAMTTVEIGSDTRIGEYCSIRDNDHNFRDVNLPIREQGMESAPVRIGRNTWVGRGVVIQKGVTVGSGVVIGANSFVNKDIPDFSVAVGCPAKIIKKRK